MLRHTRGWYARRRLLVGTQSEQGGRWVERILSVRETLRLEDRPVLAYLIRVAAAAPTADPRRQSSRPVPDAPLTSPNPAPTP